MRPSDILNFSFSAVRGYRVRSVLMLIAMAIGVAAVVVLTSLGEGARRYVTGEFASLGTHLLIVLPGRSETVGGGLPAMFVTETPRDLTLDDALSLSRNSAILRVAPISLGSAPVSWMHREREVPILGSTADLLEVRHWTMAQGRFLPNTPDQASPVCVIGEKVRHELFGAHQALGEWVRIGERRFRVIGVLATQGRSIGLDVEDIVIVPVASAQMLFNSPSLLRILVEVRSRNMLNAAKNSILATIRTRDFPGCGISHFRSYFQCAYHDSRRYCVNQFGSGRDFDYECHAGGCITTYRGNWFIKS